MRSIVIELEADKQESRLSKDETNRVNANLTTEIDDYQDPLKRLLETLSLMRNEKWIGPPTDLRVNVLQAYRDQFQRQAQHQGQQRDWLSWIGAYLSPRTRMVMASAVTLVVLVMVGVALVTLTSQDPLLTASVDEVSGLVEVKSSGSENWRPLQEGTDLQAGDRMRSGIDAMAVLHFPDGSISEMGASSQLSILQLSTSQSGVGQIAVLHQYEGQTLHKIRPQVSEDSWFEVETSVASVAVIGTEFAVEVTDFQVTIVTVSEGVVEVRGQGAALQVEAGQIASVIPGSEPAFGLPTQTPIPTCVPVAETVEPATCDDRYKEGELTSLSQGSLLEQETSANADTMVADLSATPTSNSHLTPAPTAAPGIYSTPTATTASGAAGTPTMTPPTMIPTEEGASAAEPTATPTGPSSPPPTATPFYPPATATPGVPTAPPPTSTPNQPTAPPPTSTPPPTAPPPTSTPPPTAPPPTSTPLPPPTSTPLPPTPTPIPPTATPPPPTPTPPPYP